VVLIVSCCVETKEDSSCGEQDTLRPVVHQLQATKGKTKRGMERKSLSLCDS